MNHPLRLTRNSRQGLRAAACSLVLFLALDPLASAQESQSELLQLTEASALRLGIVFDPVVAVGSGQGVTAVGQVIAAPSEGSQLHSPVAGVIDRWLVPLGEHVVEGSLLATVRSADAAARQRAWLAADIELQQARLDAARLETLLEQGVIASRRQQQAALALSKAERDEASTAQSLAMLGFDAAQRRALVEEGTHSGLALLRAPRAGRLVHQARRAEEPVAVGDEVAELQSASNKWLSLVVSTQQAQGAMPGTTLSLVNYPYSLTLRQRDYATDAQTQTLELLAEFDANAANELPLGTLVDVVIEPPRGGLLIPSTAVVFSAGKTLVYVQGAAGIEPRALSLTPIGRDYSATTGIARGERIAVRGTALLKGMQLGLGGDS